MKKVLSHSTCDYWTNRILGTSVIAIFLMMIMVVAYHQNLQVIETPDIKIETKEVHILTDEDLSKLYSCKQDVNYDTCLLISQEDAQRLMKIAVVEDNTSIESQAHVMATILNRVASDDFPDSVDEVIHQKFNGKYQFSTVGNGKYDKAEPDVNSHLALAMIESGEITSDALFFEAEYAKDTWQSKNLEYLYTIGGTKFYTNP